MLTARVTKCELESSVLYVQSDNGSSLPHCEGDTVLALSFI
jgi:hypothetical protein